MCKYFEFEFDQNLNNCITIGKSVEILQRLIWHIYYKIGPTIPSSSRWYYCIAYLFTVNSVDLMWRVKFFTKGPLESKRRKSNVLLRAWNNGKKVSMKTLLSFTTLRPIHFGAKLSRKSDRFPGWAAFITVNDTRKRANFWGVGHNPLCF